MTMTETLFSLEVHVESVEELRVSCKLPALCFRLLDFPTMIIHYVSPMEAEKMRQRFHMEDRESLLHELKDRFGNFQFRTGKSCLFKASIDTLLIQLQTVPLYTILMDLWPKKPTLVGSTLIPLKKAIDQISADVYYKGVAVPAFFRDEGDFAVYNLMGSPVAKVKLGFRLLSLGGSLIPHIPTEPLGNRVTEKVETSEKVEEAVKGALQKVLPEIESRDLSEKESTSEREKVYNNVTATQKPKIQHVEVQTNLHTKTIKSSGRQRRNSEEDVVITNTFCPPPLYYNYFSKSSPCDRSNVATTEEDIQQNSSNNDGMRYRQSLDQEDDDVDFMYYDPGVLETDGTVGIASVSVQTDEKLLRPSTGLHSNRGQDELITGNGLYNLRGVASDGHLPILNALLQELSCLTGGHVKDTTQPRSGSGQSQVTPRHPQTVGGRKPPAANNNLKSVSKSQTQKIQTRQPLPGKRTQTSVIGLPRQRVRFKQTSLTYGMTRTQKMRLEINQKDKLPNRTRPCEVQRALAQKENATRDFYKMQTPKGDLGMTYKIDTARKLKGRQMQKQTADAQVQTQQLSTEQPHHKNDGLAGTKEVMEAKSNPEVIPLIVESARSIKSQNSLDVFIPQVEGEPDEKGDQEKEWTTDKPSLGIYGNTGIISTELDDQRGGSAMTMYTEDFEDSGTEGSQASYHLAFTRSNSVDTDNLKQRSTSSDSSVSAQSQGSSKASQRPVRSSNSPVKAKSRRLKAKIQEAVSGEQKITTSEQDLEMSGDQVRSSSGSSKGLKAGSQGSYSEDFHSVGSELQNSNSDATSDDSVDEVDQHAMLDLPPPASNLGYTY